MTKRSSGGRSRPLPPRLVGAGLGRRLPAGITDAVLTLLIMDTLAVAAAHAGPAGPVLRLAAVLMPLVYFLFFETLYRQTPGKRLLGLWVVTLDGGRPDFLAHLLRCATRLPEALFVLPYVISMIVSPRNQRLGDSASDTLVVRRNGV